MIQPMQKIPQDDQEPCLNCSTPMSVVIHLYGICEKSRQRVMYVGGKLTAFDPKKISDHQLESLSKKVPPL